MTDTQPDGDVIQEFISGIARKTIADLVAAATTDDAFISKLCAVDLVPDEVAAFAKAKGFSFSADELTAFVEDRIRHEIPADERAFRDRLLAARAAGQTAEAIPTDAETSATLHDLAHAPGYALDRASVLQGDVFAFPGLPALPGLLAMLEDILKAVLEIEDPEAAHESLTFVQMKERREVAYGRLAEDDRVADLMGAIIDDLGLERDLVMWEWPGFRLLFPARPVAVVSTGQPTRAYCRRTGTPSKARPSPRSIYGSRSGASTPMRRFAFCRGIFARPSPTRHADTTIGRTTPASHCRPVYARA